jgi:uracil-DNA glycosylase
MAGLPIQDSELTSMDVQIEDSWKEALRQEFAKPYFRELRQFLRSEKMAGNVIYPPGPRIFSAFNETPLDKVKVVIIGQDPYHGEGQANGLCFSVAPGIRKPPSLLNIFKELQDDLGIPVPVNGNLDSWAKHGVLLLNATLTVRANEAGSHQNKGWEQFTDAVIRVVSEKCSGVVFLLWGRFAQAKAGLIDTAKHFILEAAHPSPLARGGFFGCKHFSKANALLQQQSKEPVDWRL